MKKQKAWRGEKKTKLGCQKTEYQIKAKHEEQESIQTSSTIAVPWFPHYWELSLVFVSLVRGSLVSALQVGQLSVPTQMRKTSVKMHHFFVSIPWPDSPLLSQPQ